MLNASIGAATPDPALIFAALGDRTRLSLIDRLSDGHPRSITALSSNSQLTRQAVTKHLRVLQDAGLVRHDRQGRENQFALERNGLMQASAYLDHVSKAWDDALGRLKSFVEGRD